MISGMNTRPHACHLSHPLPALSRRVFLGAGATLAVPAAPMRRLDDLETDPHLSASGYFQQLVDPRTGNTYVMPSAPLRFNDEQAIPKPPPRLGEHTVDILQEAGYSSQQIASLLASGAAKSEPNRS